MTVVLTPEQERILAEAIRTGLARSTDEALDQAFETLRSRLPEPHPPASVSSEGRARAFEAWARSHPRRAPLPDAAFQRENMIRDAQ
jgi:hypothetical protein